MAGSCCGKPNPGPHGNQKPKPNPQPQPKPSTSMTGATQSFTLNMASGETRTVKGSLLEAQATLARLGGRGQIR
jgi:hypothetical protein